MKDSGIILNDYIFIHIRPIIIAQITVRTLF